MTTVHTLIAIAPIISSYTLQMDVKSSFLHGELKEMFFMRIPQGLDAPKYLFSSLKLSLWP